MIGVRDCVLNESFNIFGTSARIKDEGFNQLSFNRVLGKKMSPIREKFDEFSEEEREFES